MSPIRRRTLLGRTSASIATAAASVLAGCSFGDDPGPSRTPYDVPDREPSTTTTTPLDPIVFGIVDYPDTGPPSYRRWLPAPSALFDHGSGETEATNEPTYPIQYVDVERVRRAAAAVPASFDRHHRTGKLGLDAFGIGFDQYQRVLRIGPPNRGIAVVEAAFDPGTVASTLVGTGYEQTGQRGEFELFARDDDPRAIALGTDALVWSNAAVEPGTPSVLGALETVVDAGRGRELRYHEVDEPFDRASTAAGAPAWAWFVTDRSSLRQMGSREAFGGFDAFVSTLDFGPEATYWRNDYTFAGSMDQDQLRRILREHPPTTGAARAAERVAITVDEYTAEIAAVVHADRYAEVFGPASVATYPQITWGFDHEHRDVDTAVTVTHEAGDRIPGESVVVTTRGRTLARFAERYDTVGPGDSLTVTFVTEDESTPSEIEVVCRDPEVGRRILLREYAVA